MWITDKMIDKDLRFTGKTIRKLIPNLTIRKAKLLNTLYDINKGKEVPGLNYEQHYIPRSDGSLLRICVYYSQHSHQNVPGILWSHGGGYVLENPEAESAMIRRVINHTNAVVVAPDYRRSLYAPYPAALHDCYAALKWLKRFGPEYGVRDDQLILMGASAGGGLTAALSLYARDKKEVNIAFQVPLYPMIDDRLTESSTRNNDPSWDTQSNILSWRLYVNKSDGIRTRSPYAIPARATNYNDLPPTITYVGDLEPFRDETIGYVNKLRDAGIPVAFDIFKGAFHSFDMMVPDAGVSQQALTFLMDHLRRAIQMYRAKQPENYTNNYA